MGEAIGIETPSAVEADGVVRFGVGRSEWRIVGGDVSIGFDEVVSGAIVVVAVYLIGVAGLEYGEDVMKEVVDFYDGFIGQRWQTVLGMQIVFAHGMSL